jgi:hypothetical protein
MLALAIAVGPDEQDLGAAGLDLDVLGDGLLVPVDGDVGDGVEELAGRARSPRPELLVEVQARQVAQHARHRHRAVAPPLLEVVLELVVFHVLVALDVVLFVPMMRKRTRKSKT